MRSTEHLHLLDDNDDVDDRDMFRHLRQVARTEIKQRDAVEDYDRRRTRHIAIGIAIGATTVFVGGFIAALLPGGH